MVSCVVLVIVIVFAAFYGKVSKNLKFVLIKLRNSFYLPLTCYYMPDRLWINKCSFIAFSFKIWFNYFIFWFVIISISIICLKLVAHWSGLHLVDVVDERIASELEDVMMLESMTVLLWIEVMSSCPYL